ncbi:MAG: sulfurtransferase [Candidatus Bipolaricaulia bacterium]
MAEYANPNALVDTQWVEGQLNDPNVRIVEVDEDTEAYQKGHVPGAIAWHWQDDLHDSLRRNFIGRTDLQELLARSGVSPETTVVLYGGNNNWFAAYAYWYLKYWGVENVRLMNGGRKKWELENRQLVTEVPNVAPANQPVTLPEKPRAELRAFRNLVLERVERNDAAFVDVRSPEEFRGELLAPPHLSQEQAQVPGHIPGALNITWSKAANEDGTFKSVDELKALYGDVKPKSEVIAYCRIGERSSHTWFVLKELLGYSQVRNYDGSWTEYGSLVNVPIER